MQKNSLSVIFDMDGVIIDSNPYHEKSLHVFLKQYGLNLSLEEMKKNLFGRTNYDWIRRVFGSAIPDERVHELAREKESIYREMFQDDIVPLAGLTAFVDELDRQGIPKAIATSAPKENVVFVLKHTGLDGRFNIILDDRDVEKGKPDPQIYLKTLDKMGAAPENTVIFEDSLAGVKAAAGAGCKVVGVTTTHTPDELAETGLVINDFTEVTLEKLYQLTGG